MPVDDCPLHVVANFHDFLHDYEFAITPFSDEQKRILINEIFNIHMFVEMRKRIGYSDEKINEEIEVIFTSDEIKAYKNSIK